MKTVWCFYVTHATLIKSNTRYKKSNMNHLKPIHWKINEWNNKIHWSYFKFQFFVVNDIVGGTKNFCSIVIDGIRNNQLTPRFHVLTIDFNRNSKPKYTCCWIAFLYQPYYGQFGFEKHVENGNTNCTRKCHYMDARHLK